MSSQAEFYIDYPEDVLEIDDSTTGYLEISSPDDGSLGVKKVLVHNTAAKNYQIEFTSVLPAVELASKYSKSSLFVVVEEPTVYASNGRKCDVETIDGTINFSTTSQTVLATNAISQGTNISAYSSESSSRSVILT